MVSAGLGQRALVRAIDGYRRWLSGRGPLTRVRCTFHHGETCSAYGRRVAAEAPGALAALRLIRGRLRRCADTSLYTLPADDGAADVLGWGPAYDRPLAAWQDELERARELPSTSASLLRARAAVARWRGDHVELRALAALPPPPPSPRLLVRRARAERRAVALACLRPALVALALVALALALAPPLVAAAVATLALAAVAARAGRLAGRARRLRWQRTAAAIARAAATPASTLAAASAAGAASPAPGPARSAPSRAAAAPR